VYGDSRTMMYLPPKEAQKEETIKLMVEMFNLVMPEKIAAEVVQKDVKLTYDPATGEVIQNCYAVHDPQRSHDVDGG
jgi:hypothetical protein